MYWKGFLNLSGLIDDCLFEKEKSLASDKVYILVIYDVVNDKKRNKLAKLLKGYGFRIQKSAFEAKISASKYRKLIKELEVFWHTGDCIRVYKLVGDGQVITIGKPRVNVDIDDVIIL